ncbi:unnamed protein product [Meganyctiphanes norvegica]|uniref:Uncharacterized protein n=1 Tax=Meganyctiphanes norvegica TaxID=48144 RepID=A0AAV2ST83_MEGNR
MLNKHKQVKNKNNPELDILLEPTIFGVTISGAVSTCFKQNIEVVMANHIAPMLLRDESDKQLFTTDNTHTLQEDLNFLWGQESLGILPNEIHSDDKIATGVFLDTVQCDSTTGKFNSKTAQLAGKLLLRTFCHILA